MFLATSATIVTDKSINAQDKDGNTALHRAAMRFDVEEATRLVDADANPYIRNSKGETALDAMDLAIKIRRIVNLTTSIPPKAKPAASESRCDLNMQDVHGNTALHYAAMNENKELVQMLLDSGADPTLTNNLGQTYEAGSKIKSSVRGLHTGVAYTSAVL